MIAQIGSECLRKVSNDVKFPLSKTDIKHIEHLKTEMIHNSGIGIASPQIGINKRIFIVYADKIDHYLDLKPIIVIINPKVTLFGRKIEDMEACLSINGKYGLVSRYFEAILDYNDEFGLNQRIMCKNLLARVVQHENDHLDGILYSDKVIGKLEDFPPLE